MSAALEVRGLTTQFSTRKGAVTAVNDVSFSVQPGRILGLVGESGSGKSVTGFSIMGLIHAPGRITAGEVLVQGTDMRSLSAEGRRQMRGRNISMVFQDPMMTLNPVLRVGDQMAMAVRVHDKVSKAAAWERAREALEILGLMDEGLFIDHLDTEWFLRAGAAGWQSFGVCDAVMDHGLGERTVRVWLGRWRYLPVHQPFRYYYVYRNSVLLWRRAYPSARWKPTDMLRLAKMFLVFSLFTGDRRQNLAMMIRGIRDGLKGRAGQLHSDLLR